MALKRVVSADEFNELPETARSFYVEEQGGKYRLDAEPDDGGEIKSALDHERKISQSKSREAAELRKKLDELGEIDPQEYRELKAAKSRKEEDEAKKAGQWDSYKAQLEEKHAAEITKRDQEIADLKSTVETTLKRSFASDAMREAGVDPKHYDTLMPHVLPSLRVTKDGDVFVPRVIDPSNGEERISTKPGQSGLMPPTELLETMKAGNFAFAFAGSGASGSGASQNGNGGAGAGFGKIRTLADLPADKFARAKAINEFVKQHGQEALDGLPAQ